MKVKRAYTIFAMISLLGLFLSTINAWAAPYISFSSNRTGNYDIYVMDINGENLLNLTNHPSRDSDPTWAPNGRAFAFVSNRDGNAEIYIMNLNEAEPRRLTDRPESDTRPAWSPDGKWIAFSSSIPKKQSYDIYKIDINGENLQQLTDDGKYNFSPAWSPDGEEIAFYSRPNDNGGIYVMNADGKRIRRVMRPQDRGDISELVTRWQTNYLSCRYYGKWYLHYGCPRAKSAARDT